MKAPVFKGLSGRGKKFRQRMGMHIYVLPNLLTTGNMFFGFYAIVHGIRGEWEKAAYAIVAAAVFDLLDGRVARMTNTTSQFGAEYDSLSDLVSFGMAPGILLYKWALEPFGRIGWLVSFIYVACVALRLARFNVQATTIEKSHFQGLPSPMGAGIVASSILAFSDLGWNPQGSYILLSMTILLAFVMVSSFPYRSFKDLDLKRRLPFKYLVLGVGILIVVAIKPEVNLFILFLSYAILGAVFGVLRGHKAIQIGRTPLDQITQEDDLFEEVTDDEFDGEHDEGEHSLSKGYSPSSTNVPARTHLSNLPPIHPHLEDSTIVRSDLPLETHPQSRTDSQLESQPKSHSNSYLNSHSKSPSDSQSESPSDSQSKIVNKDLRK